MTPNRLPREDEAMRVEPNTAALQPVGLRVRADEEKHMAHQPSLLDAAAVIPPRHGIDAVDQIARHACGESPTADEQMNLCGVIGQKYGGLAGRIATADQHDVFV